MKTRKPTPKRQKCVQCGETAWGTRCRMCFQAMKGTPGITKPLTATHTKAAPAPKAENPVAEQMAKTAQENRQARRAMTDTERHKLSIDLMGQWNALVDEGKRRFARDRQFDMHARFDRPSAGTVQEYRLAAGFARPDEGFRLVARYDCKGGAWHVTEFSWSLATKREDTAE